MKHPSLTSLLFCVAGLLIAGCNAGSGIPVVPVQGKITFAGGKPPAEVNILFVPVETENGLPKIPGKAILAADGTFHVVTEQAGKGLVPGRYVANIECWKQAPSMQAPVGESYLPKDFRPAQELVVKAGGGPVKYDLDIPAAP